jgi:hypothetical protein
MEAARSFARHPADAFFGRKHPTQPYLLSRDTCAAKYREQTKNFAKILGYRSRKRRPSWRAFGATCRRTESVVARNDGREVTEAEEAALPGFVRRRPLERCLMPSDRRRAVCEIGVKVAGLSQNGAILSGERSKE